MKGMNKPKRQTFSVDFPKRVHEYMEGIQERLFVDHRIWVSKNKIVTHAMESLNSEDFISKMVKDNAR
jgi:ribosomal protein L10